MMPKVDCIWVCLYKRFSTMRGIGVPLQLDDDARMPSRSDSSRRSGCPIDLPSRTSCAICSIKPGLVDHERDLGDDDPPPEFALHLLDRCARARITITRPRPVSVCLLGCPAVPSIKPPVGKSGPFTIVQLVQRAVGIVDQHARTAASTDLAEVVRRDVRCHPDRDTGDDPLTSRFGNLAGRTEAVGSCMPIVEVRARSRPSPCRCRRASPSRDRGESASVYR